ncbi:DUF305 domain-containing protein [Streptomyces sp. GD-15H]|uniref:DUF305 domain-containing protein n=1 Tax=Streptomyces sp. GD-15H TaxID=3129112 RepID=UPI003872C7F7
MTVYKRALGRSNRHRIVLVSAVAAGGLLLAACGGNDDVEGVDHGSGGSASASATANAGENPAPGAFNDADVTFAQMMTPHHEQALEMAKLADGRASDAEVKALAGEIEKAQDPEIQTMKSWLKTWGKPSRLRRACPGWITDPMAWATREWPA